MRSRASLSASSAARSHAGRGRRDLRGVDAQADRVEVDAIEFPAELDQRLVAARDDVGDDRAHRLLDVLRGLALGRKEGGKPLAKSASRVSRRIGMANPLGQGSMARQRRRVNPVSVIVS